MKKLNVMMAMVLGFAISGCAAIDTPSRNVGFDTNARSFLAGDVPQLASGVSLSSLQIVDINITVPETLAVSEENSYYPSGDIVWRGEPAGNRHQQIEAIFQEGLSSGVANLGGSVPAVLDIEVERFHGVSEKTRYTIGGVHSIRFVMVIRDSQTGEALTVPKKVKANLKAYGGQSAIEADRQGQTQRVRIVAHLSDVIQSELGRVPQQKAVTLALPEDAQQIF